MLNERLQLALIAVFGAGLIGWLSLASPGGNEKSLNMSEVLLFRKIDLAIGAFGPSPATIASAFALPHECREQTCWLKGGKIASMTYSEGDLRPGDDGLVFVLDGLGGECVRTSRIADRFDTIGPHQSCHDAVCWYQEAKHPWGILAFETDEPDSPCVSSVVINTLPYQRGLESASR